MDAEDRNTCPHCGTDLRGDPIPVENRDKYYGGKEFFMRTITVEIRGVYDGGLYHRCPDCGGAWHRWPEGHYLREKAEQYVRRENDSD